MKNKLGSFLLPFLAAVILQSASAAVPPAERLLPPETVGVLSIPNWNQALNRFNAAPFGQFFQDPAMRPFREKFLQKSQQEFVSPLEKELNLRLRDYATLLQGQLTFAVTHHEAAPVPHFGIVVLADSGSKKEDLARRLADLRKQWNESGQPVKSESIRGVDVFTVTLDFTRVTEALSARWSSIFGGEDEDEETEEEGDEPTEPTKKAISFAQSDSLLVIATDPRDVERILIRQSAAAAPTLAEQAAFESDAPAFRNAQSFGWLHARKILDQFKRQIEEASRAAQEENPFAVRPDRVITALGLDGLQTIGFHLTTQPDGMLAEFSLNVPAATRQGLFRLLSFEPKDASPPSFVPADAVKFTRIRLDGQKVWATLEAMVAAISPELGGLLQMGIATVGKDKDPNFDLKKSLIANLGDDFVAFEKSPRASTLQAVQSPPALMLIGSPNPEQLASALKATTGLLPTASPDGALRERDFLGRKVYSITLPQMTAPEEPAVGPHSLHFAASRDYVALSTDVAILEEFLRSSGAEARALRENRNLNEAAQKIGGQSTGFFGFENQRETMRVSFEALKNDRAGFQQLFNLGAGDAKRFSEWLDFNLLPPFEQVAKYFHIGVYNGTVSPEGFRWRFYTPNPPNLR